MKINAIKSGNCQSLGIPESLTQPLVGGLHPRVSMAVLGHVSGIQLSDASNPAAPIEASADLCQGDKFRFAPAPTLTWLTVSTYLRSQLNRAAEISLVASPRRRALPGDLVRTTIEWRNVTDGIAKPYAVAQVQSTISEEGRALIPGLASPSLSAYHPPGTIPPIVRESISDLDGHAFEIELWKRGRGFSEQFTLQSISACLAAIWSLKDNPGTDVTDQVDRCADNGIEDFIFSDNPPPSTNIGANNNRVRYQIEVDQHWTLVSETGLRAEQTYYPGETLKTGISRALRRFRSILEAKGVKCLTLPARSPNL